MSSVPPALPSIASEMQVNEFPDWMSPVVVKELRQGLRSKAFIVSFCLLHGALILLFILTLIGESQRGGVISPDAVNTLNSFFWMIVAVPLVFILPASALTLIGAEVSAKTMELVQLTKMSPLRIVQGKWFALAIQILLLIVTVLPYFTFRYFLGKIDLISEFLILGTLTLSSLTLSAFFLFASTLSRIWRILILIQLLPMLLFGGIGSIVALERGGFGWLMDYTAIIGISVLVSGVYIFYFLLMAATFMCGGQFTWSGVKRFLAIMIFGAGLFTLGAVSRSGNFDSTWYLISVTLLPILVCLMFEGLCYHPTYSTRERLEFAKASLLGKVKTCFSLTGWPVHFLFNAALFFVGTLAVLLDAFRPSVLSGSEALGIYELARNTAPIIAILGFASFTFHLVVSKIFKSFRSLFYLALIIQVMIGGLGMILMSILILPQTGVVNGIHWMCSLIPQVALQVGWIDLTGYPAPKIHQLYPAKLAIIPSLYLIFLFCLSLKNLWSWLGLKKSSE